jgi:hypothetical protein
MLHEAEQTSFRAGLHTRLQACLHDALEALTADEYRARRDRSATRYHALSVLVNDERDAGPATSGEVFQFLERVEAQIGEAERHQLEHAINTSNGGERLVTKLASSEPPDDQTAELALVVEYARSWLMFAWSVDAVVFMVDRRQSVHPEVVTAIWDDLAAFSTDIYAAASALFDLRFGDPDDADDE